MKRRTLTSLQRLKVWENHEGRCHICGLRVVKGWEVEHIIPLALGGLDEETNLAPAHPDCHTSKTRKDRAQIAKATRQRAFHVGAKQPRWPKTKWKRKVSGETVLRKGDAT